MASPPNTAMAGSDGKPVLAWMSWFQSLVEAASGSVGRVTLPSGVQWSEGSGSPEGAVTAKGGSLYSDNTGFRLYVKQSASGNTGWVVK